ncbi:MAG: hypothetical protein NTX51_11630 [Verrucomicrobia bacterium]|nr:hypothetical protein [Verrucomicrobiota bacterium]
MRSSSILNADYGCTNMPTLQIDPPPTTALALWRNWGLSFQPSGWHLRMAPRKS